MSFDYSKLRGKIREVYKTQEAFANAMGCSTATISGKLNCNVDFSQDEIIKAVKVLRLNLDDIPAYFFAELV